MGSGKKRSERLSPTRALLDYVFFLDRSIDNDTLAAPIIAAGFLLQRFPFKHNASDPKWLKHCADRGWIGLSGDQRITRKPHEMDAVMESGVALFVLKTGEYTNHRLLGENFLRTASKIVDFYENNAAPYIASVTRPNEKDWRRGLPGNVRMWRTYKSWRAHRHRR